MIKLTFRRVGVKYVNVSIQVGPNAVYDLGLFDKVELAELYSELSYAREEIEDYMALLEKA